MQTPLRGLFLLQLLLLTLLGLGALSARAASFADTRTDTASPVIFIHGYSRSGGDWDTLRQRFVADGYPAGHLYTFEYNSLFASNKTSAGQLAALVDSVRSRHNNAPVVLIAHSNGGLVARWYRVKLGGSSAVRRFITLGTPHAGTTSAYYCFSPACFEMWPRSRFLSELGGLGCDVSLWSARDGVITPAASAQCGRSVQTDDLAHLDLPGAASVYQLIRAQW